MRRLKLTILIFFITSLLFGQNFKIDSLKNQISHFPNDIEAILKLSEIYEDININSAIYYSNLIIKIGKNQNNNSIIARGYHSLGLNYYTGSKYDEALKYYFISLKYSLNNIQLTNKIYLDIANTYFQKRDIINAKKYADKISLLKDEKKLELRLNLLYSGIFQNLNEFDQAFNYAQKAYKLSVTLNDYKRQLRIKNTIANIYDSRGEKQKAIEIYLDIINNIKPNVDSKSNVCVWYYNLASTYIKMDNYKDGEIYLKKAEDIIKSNPLDKMQVYISIANSQIELKNKNYKKALSHLEKASNLIQTTGITNRVADVYYWRSKIFKELKDYNLQREYLIKAIYEYNENKLNNELIDCYIQLMDLNNKTNNNDKNFLIFNSILSLKDSIFNENKINSSIFYEFKYQTAEKEAKIKEQELQLEKEKLRKNQLYYGIGLLALISLGGYLWNRNRQKRKHLESENVLLDMKSNLAQMELQNLNQQLDPHEVKNMLQTLAPEIQVKAPEAYKNLIHLSQLTKAALNNKSITDSLENQLQQIESYLEIEKKIVSHPLSWQINNAVANSQIQLPRLILKNMVENAVKHGIKNLSSEGIIQVEVTEVGKFINLVIDDNGIGRKQSVSLDSGIGTSTYFKLFDTLNAKNKHKATMEIIDKEVGTKVEIKIPLDYKYD